MPPQLSPGAERPRSITIMGRVSLVVAVFCVCKNLVNLAVWTSLEPDAPSLFKDALAEMPKFLQPLLAHVAALMTVQAFWWAFVVVASIGLLRLQPWARVAFQVICWGLLAYIVLFGIFWTTIWPNLPARGTNVSAAQLDSYRMIGLTLGLTVSAAVAAGLIAMILRLRSAGVREAFARSRETEPRF